MKRWSILGVFIIIVIIVFATIFLYSIPGSRYIRPSDCSFTFIPEESLNITIVGDQQALDVLKQYWKIYDKELGKKVSDPFLINMTADQAIQQGALRSNIEIRVLDTHTAIPKNISGTWMIYQYYAVDTAGNVYRCSPLEPN